MVFSFIQALLDRRQCVHAVPEIAGVAPEQGLHARNRKLWGARLEGRVEEGQAGRTCIRFEGERAQQEARTHCEITCVLCGFEARLAEERLLRRGGILHAFGKLIDLLARGLQRAGPRAPQR